MENKNKKTRLSKKLIAFVAIVLMMGLIVGMGAMTYSKYVTSENTGSQTATAAKWGFVVTADASDLFGTDYTKGADASSATVVTTTGTNGVAVNAESRVVAPGTSGSMTVTVSGSAEVLAQIKFEFSNGSKEIKFGDYSPVKWTLKEGDKALVTKGSFADLAVKTSTIAAGSSLPEDGVVYTISWEWELNDSDESNKKDTIIGYKSSGTAYNYLPVYLKDVVASEENYNNITTEMQFGLKVTIEQIQTTGE